MQILPQNETRSQNDITLTLTDEWIYVVFSLGQTTAPSLNDVKLIVDIDPRNTFGEAQRHRGNNRCIATW